MKRTWFELLGALMNENVHMEVNVGSWSNSWTCYDWSIEKTSRGAGILISDGFGENSNKQIIELEDIKHIYCMVFDNGEHAYEVELKSSSWRKLVDNLRIFTSERVKYDNEEE